MNDESKKKMQDVEDLEVGVSTKLLGYDPVARKTGLVPISRVNGGVPWFGRKWTAGNSSPVGKPIGDIDLGKELPYQIGLGGYLVQNNHSRVKLSASNHNLLENGGAADLTGAAGHYQWGWNVPMYYQVYLEDGDLCETFSLGGPRKGYWNYRIPVGSRSCAGYATMDRNSDTLVSFVNKTAQFRGGNNDATKDADYNSQLGVPATNLSIEAFRNAARRNGTLWFANERVMHYVTGALMRVIFGTRNVQAGYVDERDSYGLRQGGLGAGVSLPDDWQNDWSYYPYVPLDTGVQYGDLTGVFSTGIVDAHGIKDITGIPSFFGLKNFYKYLYCMSENMLLQCNADKSQSLFISNNIDGSLMSLASVAGLTKIATGPSIETAAWTYPEEMTLKNLAFFPKDTGGSSSTFWCDGYFNPASTSGLRGALLLGPANYGAIAGWACLDGSNAPSAALANRAAFLCEWAEEFTTLPVWAE